MVAALHQLAERGELDRSIVEKAIAEFGLDPKKPSPWTV